MFRPETSIGDMTDIYKFFILIFVLACTYVYCKENDGNNIFKWINIFAILNAAATIFQRITGIGLAIIENVPRAQGLLGHPNITGFFVNIYLPVGIYMYLKSTTKKDKFFWMVGILTNLLSLLLAMAKIAYISLAFQIFILLFFIPFKMKMRIIFSIIGLGIAVLLVNFIFNMDLTGYIMERFHNSSSFEWRIKVWTYLLGNMDILSIFTGHGINSVLYYLMQVNFGESPFAHNLYLQLLYEYGLWGSFYYAGFFVVGLKFLKTYFTDKTIDKVFVSTPILIISGILINMASDNPAFQRTSMFIAWSTITVFYLQLREHQRKKLELEKESRLAELEGKKIEDSIY